MTAPSSLSEQVLALPSGAGGIGGLGETFAADPYTGTGWFQVPIPLPAGHGGQKPGLSLVYSSGAGAGVCGTGWSFGVGSIRRRTEKGIPTYDDSDVFLLGDEELVPLADDYYQPRVEGGFARIRLVRAGGDRSWAIAGRDGSLSLYGRTRDARDGTDTRAGAWLLSEIRDRNDNRIAYTYDRDPVGNRSYLTEISWGNGAFRVQCAYEDRPDVLRNARLGYLEVTDRRLARIDVQVKRTSTGAFSTFDSFALSYLRSPITGNSLLAQVSRIGTAPDGSTRSWPTLTLSYHAPDVGPDHVSVSGHPGRSLADPDLALADLDGDALPDLIESTSAGWLLRRNLGDGKFGNPVPITGPAARLRESGVFFSDMRGTATPDLVAPSGFYPTTPTGFGPFRRFELTPGFDLDRPDTRFLDLDGDGIGDVVVDRGTELHWYPNRQATRLPGGRPATGFGDPVRVTALPTRLPRFDDPWTRIADTTGDGLVDWVRVSHTGIEVFESLGHGRFASPRLLPLPTPLPADLPPEAITLADVTGTGCADVLARVGNEVWIYPNGSGHALGARIVVAARAAVQRGTFEAVDLLGTGVRGLLLTEASGWSFYRLFGDRKPDLLSGVDNGMGASTAITYGSSVAEANRDRAAADPWRTPLPFPVMVVVSVAIADMVSGVQVTSRIAYHHGYYDASERELRGFAMVDTFDTERGLTDTTSAPPARTRRFFDVGNGMRLRDRYAPIPGVLQAETIPTDPQARRATRGALLREEVFADDGSPLSGRPYQITHTTHTVREVVGAARPRSVLALPTVEDVYLVERSHEYRHHRTTRVFDRYGRLLEERERGAGRLGTFPTEPESTQAVTLERYTRTTWLTRDEPEPESYDGPWSPAWLLDAVSTTERWGVGTPTDTLLSRERCFYDVDYEGLGYPGSATSLAVVRGNCTARLLLAHTDELLDAVFPGGSGAGAARDDRGQYVADGDEYFIATERRAFDARGMTLGGLDPSGNQTTIAYDAEHGLFPVSATDAAGHPTTLERGDFPHQVLAVVDANDNRTELTYNAGGLPATRTVMGKVVGGVPEGDTTAAPTETFTYDLTTVPVTITTATRQVKGGATFDVTRYLDGLGRTLQERHTAENDPITNAVRYRVTGWQQYNHKGLVVRAYQPTFAATLAYAPGAIDVPSVETTYDPLGRPVRVDHPDGTHETTDYHPWVRTAFDRNDNATALSPSNLRYGAHLRTFRDHLQTPTRLYFDALGREIAVAEDNGAGTTPTFRVTTYEITSGFTGTTYDLTLHQALAPNYFVMLRGMVSDNAPTPASSAVRVTDDPFGTGDLGSLSPVTNVLRLTRASSTQGAWQGTVVVWECLGDTTASGFQLLDVKTLAFPSTAAGTEHTATATSSAWSSLAQVALYGGAGGGGATSTSTAAAAHPALHAMLTPSSTATLTGSRWRTSGTLPAADFTVYVVQWGSEHQIQRVEVASNAGGDGLDATSEWRTGSISAVRSATSWVSATGWTTGNGVGNSFHGTVVALGDGVSAAPDVATAVAVGNEVAAACKVLVTVHTHPGLSVHHVRKADGDSAVTTYAHGVAPPGETEAVVNTGSLQSTAGLRVPLHHASSGTTGTAFNTGTWFARHTAEAALTARRLASGQPWVGMVQSVDTVGVVRPDVGSPDYHVTRSVLDLKDQLVEVWDARGLLDATWKFRYDYASNRLRTEHTTGTGTRWALPDASGSPIWSRDARGVAIDRTFDALRRPLTESSTFGATTKLRRMWTYLAYDSSDAAAKAKNLFGRVEEERDVAGLRFFEYDWRGLVTKTSHRFFGADWNNQSWSKYADVDDDALPAGVRATLSYLTLTSLTDTTTVEVSTTYDAVGHPRVVSYPEGMKVRSSWNTAGLLQAVECDRGAGIGYGDIMSAATYNARGQLTGHVAGNGLVTSREFDPETERLTRIFTRASGGTSTRFQDQQFAYDPMGNPVLITDALATTLYASNLIMPNTRSYRYDPRYRLVRATGRRHKDATDGLDAPVTPSPSRADYVPYTHRYSYDAVGNFTTNQEYKSGTNNLDYKAGFPDLFDGYGAESYSYDANGACTATPRHQTIGYSFDGQPVFVDMGGGTKIRYRRHGDQRVVRCMTKTGVTAVGIYLGPWEYHARTGTTAYVKLVLSVTGHGRHAQVARVLSGADPDTLPVFFVHADHIASAQVLTRLDGSLLCHEEFFAYGRSSDRRDGRSCYRYLGVPRDSESGLDVTGPRLLDTKLGRFLQPEPLYVLHYTPYCYAKCSPIRRSDFNGYSDQDRIDPSAGEQSTHPDADISIPVYSSMLSDKVQTGETGPTGRYPPTKAGLGPMPLYDVLPFSVETGEEYFERVGTNIFEGYAHGDTDSSWNAPGRMIAQTADPIGLGYAHQEALSDVAEDPSSWNIGRAALGLGPIWLLSRSSTAVTAADVLKQGGWAKGSFASAEESLAKHFELHKKELGADTADRYVRQALNFATRLHGIRPVPVQGATEGVMRYTKNGRYIDLTKEGTIVSFGSTKRPPGSP